MRDNYRDYPASYHDQTFVGDWLMSRPLDDECVGDVAQRAREGDEGAVIALLRIEGRMPDTHMSEGAGTKLIGCQRSGCDGCVKLIMENAGVEVIDCSLPADQAELPPDLP